PPDRRRPPSGRCLRLQGASAVDRAHQLRDLEREIQRLACVQARGAERGVSGVELLLGEPVAAAETLGDVVAGDLDVDAAGPRARVAVHREEALDLTHDVPEVARL